MRYRKLTATGDYTFGNGQLDYFIDVPAAVAQAIQTWLKLFQGEWYLDNTQGTPWFQGVLGKYSQAEADDTLQTQIAGVIGVVNIQNFQSTGSPATRNYQVTSCVVNTQFGPTPVQIANEQEY